MRFILNTEILTSKKFHTLRFSKSGIVGFILATFVSLYGHLYYEIMEKICQFFQVAKMATINADEYFLCIR